MFRRAVPALALAIALGGFAAGSLSAHSGLRRSDPIAGATLGASPTVVTLTFSETPEASLSEIRVLHASGAACQLGAPHAVAGDPLSIAVRLRPLSRGVYLVSWRVVSAVDAHATTGTYAFGVGVAPRAARQPTASAESSPVEILARWMFLAGLVALLGAASATIGRFGSAGDLRLAAAGWCLAAAGVVLLAVAKRFGTTAALAALMDTAVGRALVWRATAIAVAGVALIVARFARPARYRPAMAAAALAALAGMAVHVMAGHAAAGAGWSRSAAIVSQWAHFAAAGVWMGGLAALLLAVRGTPDAPKAAAVRRFSSLAAIALLVVVATGLVRAVGELALARDLIADPYGQALLAKIALTVGIAALGAANRWRGVPRAISNLAPLRRAGAGEVALALAAIAAAAAMGSLPPPAQTRPAPGISATASDFATTVVVQLAIASERPGPNQFTVEVDDYDSREPVRGARVTLRFAPIDDPGVAPTSLPLTPVADGRYEGSGPNLAFGGRWRVTVLVQRGADTVEVPIEIETRGLAGGRDSALPDD